MRRWNRFVVSGITAIATLSMTAMTAFAGSLTVSAPASVSFPAITLNGASQNDQTDLGDLTISDTTGTGDGYHVTAQETQFVDSSTGHSLPNGSVSLSTPAIQEQAVDGMNLLRNAGFENKQSTNGAAYSWTPDATGGSTTLSLTGTVIHSGNQTQKLSVSGLGDHQMSGIYQEMTDITPGSAFDSGAYIDVTGLTNAEVQLEADFYDGSGGLISQVNTDQQVVTSGYQYIHVASVIPTGTASVRFSVLFEGISTSSPGSGTGYLDDCSFQESTDFIPQNSSNLVSNGGLETVNGTSPVYTDALTQQSGWSIQSGDFTFSQSGATSSTNGSVMTMKNLSWTPMTGSSGQDLALTGRTAFTEPSTLGEAVLQLDSLTHVGQNYEAYWNNGTFGIWVNNVSGGHALVTTPLSLAANTTYFVQFSIDVNHQLVASISSASGTQLATLTGTDTSVSGPYYPGIYADSGITFTNLEFNAPFPAGWGLGGNTTGRYLAQSSNDAFSGNKGIEFFANDLDTNEDAYIKQVISSVIGGRPFTASCAVEGTSLSSADVFLEIDWHSNGTFLSSSSWNGSISTHSYQPIHFTGTIPASATTAEIFAGIRATNPNASGDILVDNLSFQYETTSPPARATPPWVLDSGNAMTIMSTPKWTGMGTYDVSFPTNALTLTVAPASTYKGSYTSTLTWSMVTGP